MSKRHREPASFRDPNGYLYWQEGVLYRQINAGYKDNYDLLMTSGLYQKLVEGSLLIPHEEVQDSASNAEGVYKTILPERVPFVSYPYEWSFGQLKDAALVTLAIQNLALEFGMTLKDSSAYNIQFYRGKPILIDTLSFEKYDQNKPWVAYRQFCQHFLAPLALMSHKDIRLNQLARIYIDGVPLDLASKLLPSKTRFDFSLLTHIHLHAAAQKRYAGKKVDVESSKPVTSKTGLLGILSSLENTIRKLVWNPAETAWADYEKTHNYTDEAIEIKKTIVKEFIDRTEPASVWDLGANTGVFSRLASDQGINTLAFDIDPGAVELNYRLCLERKEEYLLPLVLDLTNPSPDLGWHNQERQTLAQRMTPDLILALALVHHLAISNNVSFDFLARYLADHSPGLVIEFVPKQDPQTQRLLTSREDIFGDYDQENFEMAFGEYYRILDSKKIEGTERVIYLMERKS